jgi:hypothetical protein
MEIIEIFIATGNDCDDEEISEIFQSLVSYIDGCSFVKKYTKVKK